MYAWTRRAALALTRSMHAMRAYASVVPKPKVQRHFPYQDARKGFSERKTFLFAKYERMLRENELVILFRAENLNVKLMNAIRHNIAQVKIPEADRARLVELNGGAPWTWPTAMLTMARTGLLRPVCRKDLAQSIQGLEPYLHGPVALLTCPVLSPEYVGKVLRAMDRPVTAAANSIDPKSGKKEPLLKPVVAVAERARLIDAKGLPAFTKLPNLPTVRAQLVGLLSSPGQQLAGVLSQAGGGELAATLEARRRDLEEPESS